MAKASPHFDSYRSKYPLRQPDLSNMRNSDELQNVSREEDVFSLEESGSENIVPGSPNRGSAPSEAKYLWVVSSEDIHVAPEEGPTGRSLSRARLAHTNLVGGKEAHAGGELWFRDQRSIWLNGGSGRYPPRSRAEMEELVWAYRSAGYLVCSAGWDDDLGGGAPARMFRGEDVWM